MLAASAGDWESAERWFQQAVALEEGAQSTALARETLAAWEGLRARR
jgi:hypothetical protein